MGKKFFITTPIYYVNDRPHIGHLYTTLAADVLARYYREQGREVFFLTGTDEHGQKIQRAADKAGKDTKKFCDENFRLFQKTFQAINISNNDFIRTTEKRHQQGVYKFFQKIKPFIYQGKYHGLYCTGCEKFLTEKELDNGQCPDHKTVPEKIEETNYFFKLRELLPEIKRLIQSDEFLIEPGERREEALNFCDSLEDFSISREKVTWGIPFPGDKTQTIYVWMEALLNYWTAGRDENNFWPPDVQIIGKDILRFHAIYWPALLLAAGESLPKKLFVHGHFTVGGQKMSKSLGNVIDPLDLVKEFGVEATRYVLLAQFSFGQDGDISLEKLRRTYNADLANGLGNLVNRVSRLNVKLQNSNFESAPQDLKLQDLQFYEVIRAMQAKIKQVDRFLDKEEPWKKQAEEKNKIIRQAWKRVLEVAQTLKPFMPETAEKILKREGIFFEKR